MRSKTLSLRHNQQKRKNNYDLNSLDFYGVICALNFDNFYKLYIALFYFCTFHQSIFLEQNGGCAGKLFLAHQIHHLCVYLLHLNIIKHEFRTTDAKDENC
jgi:hypothetical protein